MLQNVSRNSIGFQTTSGTYNLNAFATFKTVSEKTVSEILSATDQNRKEDQGRLEKPNENKKAQQIFGALFLFAYRENTRREQCGSLSL